MRYVFHFERRPRAAAKGGLGRERESQALRVEAEICVDVQPRPRSPDSFAPPFQYLFLIGRLSNAGNSLGVVGNLQGAFFFGVVALQRRVGRGMARGNVLQVERTAGAPAEISGPLISRWYGPISPSSSSLHSLISVTAFFGIPGSQSFPLETS